MGLQVHTSLGLLGFIAAKVKPSGIGPVPELPQLLEQGPVKGLLEQEVVDGRGG